MNDQQRAAMQDDPYNGDDGPGFDYEFHAKLLCGAHLLDENDRVYFNIGWKAGRNFEAEKQAQPQGEHPPSRHCECAKCVEYFGDSVCESSFHPETWKPQGEWVDLRDVEIGYIYDDVSRTIGQEPTLIRFAKSVIAKFKEKNTPPVVPQGKPVVCEHCKGTGLINNGECIFDCHYCNRIGK